MNQFPPARKDGKTPFPFHGYATHQQILLREALKAASGKMVNLDTPVFLETGCGFYSTPLLYEVARAFGGNLISLVEDMEWAANFDYLCRKTYRQIQVDCDKPFPVVAADLVFMDHERKPKDRAWHIPELLGMAPVVVAHDSEWMDLSGLDAHVDSRFTPKTAVIRRNSQDRSSGTD